MMSNLSSTYFKNASACADVARTTPLGNIREQQLGAEKAWRILGDRALATEQKARVRAAASALESAPSDDGD